MVISPKLKTTATQLCLTLCNKDYTVHGILQATILEWVAVPFSKGSSQPRDHTQVSHIAGGFFTSWATRETKVQQEGSDPNTEYRMKIGDNAASMEKSKIWFQPDDFKQPPWKLRALGRPLLL